MAGAGGKLAEKPMFDGIVLEKVGNIFVGIDENPQKTWQREFRVSMEEGKFLQVKNKFRDREHNSHTTRTYLMRVKRSEDNNLKSTFDTFVHVSNKFRKRVGVRASDIENPVDKLLENPTVSMWVESNLKEKGPDFKKMSHL